MTLNFAIQHDDNGNITGTWGPSEMAPPIRANQLVLPAWVDVQGKRVNTVMQCLENCPKLAKERATNEILYNITKQEARIPRAMLDKELRGDSSWLQDIDEQLELLREELRVL